MIYSSVNELHPMQTVGLPSLELEKYRRLALLRCFYCFSTHMPLLAELMTIAPPHDDFNDRSGRFCQLGPLIAINVVNLDIF